MQVEGIAIRIGSRSVRLRPFGEGVDLTVRMEVVGVEPIPVPGEIVQAEVNRRWVYGGGTYAMGRMVATRLDASLLGLEPLAVVRRGDWSLREGRDEGGAISLRIRRLAPARAPDWEMEQVIPGCDPDDHPDNDPAIRAVGLANQGFIEEGLDGLSKAVAQDLRYLDGHAHLGSVVLRYGRNERTVGQALRHYAVGAAIGETFLAAPFAGYLRAAWVDNRPYLRCLHGLALCQGAAGLGAAAHDTLERLLRLDPQDRMGAEYLLEGLERGNTDEWLAD